MVDFEFSIDVIQRVIRELEEAKDYIRIAIFQLHNPMIFRVLNKKLDDGVNVQIFTLPYDSINPDIQTRVVQQFNQLEENGAIIYFCKWNIGDPERTTTAVGRWYSFHGKFIVTDKAAIALSANFTDQNELDATLIYRDDKDKIEEFNIKFNELVELFINPVSGFDGNIRNLIIDTGYLNSGSLFELPRVIQSDTHRNHWIKDYPTSLCPDDVIINDHLYICPFDIKGRNIMLQLIGRASTFLYISTESFTDQDFASELIKTKLRGIDVRILTGATSMDFTDRLQKMLRDLVASGIDTNTTYENLHSKLVVADSFVAVSSINLNKMNLGFRTQPQLWRENTETITICSEAAIITGAKKQFETIFNGGVNISVVLAEKIQADVGNIFKRYYGLRSRKSVKILFSRYILGEEINVKKITLKIGKITRQLVSSSGRILVEDNDFIMALILHFLSERKYDYDHLEEKLNSLNATIDLSQLLFTLISYGYVEQEDDYYKLRVESLF